MSVSTPNALDQLVSDTQKDNKIVDLINAPDDDSFATGMAARYTLKILERLSTKHRFAQQLAYQVERDYDFMDFGFDASSFGKNRTGAKDNRYSKNYKKSDEVDAEDWNLILETLQDLSDELGDDYVPTSLGNMLVLCDHFGMTENEKEVIKFLHVYSASDDLRKISSILPSKSYNQMYQFIAAVTGVETEEVKALLDFKTSKLNQIGFIMPYADEAFWEVGEDNLDDVLENFPVLNPSLLRQLSGPLAKAPEELYERIGGKVGETELTLEDFNYLGHIISDASRALENAKKSHDVGHNIVIAGAPGGGKTEFVKVLCNALGFVPIMAAEDEDTTSQGPGARLNHYKLQNALATMSDKAIMIFDECEDAIRMYEEDGDDNNAKKRKMPSKLMLNRTLEENKTPAIWICNDIDVFHPSLLSRFGTVVMMPDAKPKVRAQLTRNIAAKNNVEIGERDIRAIAKTYNFSARDITKAIQSAIGTEPSDTVACIRRNLEQRGRIQNNDSLAGYINPASPYSAYDLDLMNVENRDLANLCAEKSVNVLAQQVLKGQETAVLLTGPLGTGSRAFIEHLEYETTRDVANVDIAAIWQTPGEKIAGALDQFFLQARDKNVIVAITEGEGVLPTPESQKVKPNPDNLGALFSVMRRYPEIPVVIAVENTEGFPEKYDRFFTNRIDFKPLNAPLLQKAYERLFGSQLPDSMRDEKEMTLKSLVDAAHYSVRLEPGQQDVLIKAGTKSNDNDPRSGLNIGFGRPLKHT